MRNDSPVFWNSASAHEKWGSFEGIRTRFLSQYERIPTDSLLLEYDERIRIFREFGYYGEAKILEDGKRIWNDLRTQIGEERFREELIMTLAVAFHSSFVIIPKKSTKTLERAAKIQEGVVQRTSSSLFEQ